MYLFNKIILVANAQVIGAGAPPPNDWLSYANFIYPFALSVAAVLALIMIIVAGLEMMTASEGMRSDAKQKIQNALLGLLLAVGTYLILNTINPDLLNLRIDTAGLKVDVVGQGNPTSGNPAGNNPSAVQGSCIVNGLTFSLTKAQCSSQGGCFDGPSTKKFDLTQAQCSSQGGCMIGSLCMIN